ncbi:MAG: hypothetical protein BMS9Abin29_1313 [Gemmatimonadota bacterium]|nr:MAG: hypothetical protein BMS9Abin29_1313 [Gemmatimonadota bacterium]
MATKRSKAGASEEAGSKRKSGSIKKAGSTRKPRSTKKAGSTRKPRSTKKADSTGPSARTRKKPAPDLPNADAHDDGERVGTEAAEPIVDGVTELISAAFGVGASTARAFARATAGEHEVEKPQSDRPLDEMVHYIVASITNVVRLFGSAISGAVGLDDEQEAGQDPAGAPARATSPNPPADGGLRTSVPTVARGGTLRVPLSIENPGPEPMDGLAVRVGEVAVENAGPGQMLATSAVRFEPQTLNIAPHDFEKLTVFVDTEPDTATGTYALDVQIGSEAHLAHLHFSVVGPPLGQEASG